MPALWIHSAPPEIVASVSDQEKRRQEVIHELICAERNFVRDMEYLRDFLVKPLHRTVIIPERHRAEFVEHAFRDLGEIIAVNTRLRNALNMWQEYVIVEKIGDIVLDLVKSLANPASPTAARTETFQWHPNSQESQGWRCDCGTSAKVRKRHLESCPRNPCKPAIKCPCCSQIFVGGSRKSALKKHVVNLYMDKLHLLKKYKDTLDGISSVTKSHQGCPLPASSITATGSIRYFKPEKVWDINVGQE
ncbi:RHO1 GDP-GTP exchange protein 2 [Tulasnella sp. 408]|nr:RHO1 GDP-GTP exchange protein 2 [Tulasnella sp. 408]